MASMMEVVAASMAAASTDEASTNEAPPSSWAATDTPTTMDLVMDLVMDLAMELVMELATGTESLPVTMAALSSGSV